MVNASLVDVETFKTTTKENYHAVPLKLLWAKHFLIYYVFWSVTQYKEPTDMGEYGQKKKLKITIVVKLTRYWK